MNIPDAVHRLTAHLVSQDMAQIVEISRYVGSKRDGIAMHQALHTALGDDWRIIVRGLSKRTGAGTAERQPILERQAAAWMMLTAVMAMAHENLCTNINDQAVGSSFGAMLGRAQVSEMRVRRLLSGGPQAVAVLPSMVAQVIAADKTTIRFLHVAMLLCGTGQVQAVGRSAIASEYYLHTAA